MFCSRNSLKSLKHPKISFAPENFSGHFLARNWNFASRKPWEFLLKTVCLWFEFILVRNWKKFRNYFLIPYSLGILCIFAFCKRHYFHLGHIVDNESGLFAIFNTRIRLSGSSSLYARVRCADCTCSSNQQIFSFNPFQFLILRHCFAGTAFNRIVIIVPHFNHVERR